jgi:uncharacterized protein (DUF4415 family)
MKKRTKIDAKMVDNENPEWTAADFRKARPAREMAPEIVAAYERSRGRPLGRKKAVISLSVDKDVIAALRASGTGWQTRVNDLLKAAVGIMS